MIFAGLLKHVRGGLDLKRCDHNFIRTYRGGVKLKVKVTYAVGQMKSAVFKNGQFSEIRNTVGKTKK